MATPMAWQRVLELADANLRIARNSALAWGEDEDPEEVIPLLVEHGLFEHRLSDTRMLFLNGSEEAVSLDGTLPGGDEYDLVIEPGQAKMLFRGYVDAVITPKSASVSLSTEGQIIRLLELELDRIGYRYG